MVLLSVLSKELLYVPRLAEALLKTFISEPSVPLLHIPYSTHDSEPFNTDEVEVPSIISTLGAKVS